MSSETVALIDFKMPSEEGKTLLAEGTIVSMMSSDESECWMRCDTGARGDVASCLYICSEVEKD